MSMQTGSQHFVMMKSVTQSLAGRTALIQLFPFSLEESRDSCDPPELDDLICRGFYPRVLMQDLRPAQAYADYVATYVERDLRQLSSVHNLQLFERFLRLCAGRCGQLLNVKNLADDAGIAHTTAAAWLDLLGIESVTHLRQHPLRGHLFENLVIIDALKHRLNRVLGDNLYFYRDSNHVEVDLLCEVGRTLIPIEIKAGQTISSDYFKGLTAFGRVVNDCAGKGIVVYGGVSGQRRTQGIVIPLAELNTTLESVFSEGHGV